MPPSYYFRNLEMSLPERVKELQWRKLKWQLDYVYHRIPFYRNLCEQNKIRPEKIDSFQAFYDRWPIISKADLIKDQEANPPWGSRWALSLEQAVQTHLTSGTTGQGQEVYLSNFEDLEYLGSCWAAHLYWAGIRKGDLVANLWPLATMAASLSMAQGLIKLGANPLHIAIFDAHTKLAKYLCRFPVKYLVTVPAYLTRLAYLCRELSVEPKRDMPHLQGIIISTEAYPVAWAQAAQEFWGAKIFESYGLTQQGAALAGSCEGGVVPEGRRGALHLVEYYTLVEVVDRHSLKPADSGEEGEPIITTLERKGAPLIRFRTEDKVVFLSHKECPCGRPFNAFQAGTIARYDDMMKVKGVNIWPQAVDEVVLTRPEIEEYNGRLFLTEQGQEVAEVRLAFKTERDLSREEKARATEQVSKELKSKTGINMVVKEVKLEELERFEFKPRRWTDLRKVGLERVKFVERAHD